MADKTSIEWTDATWNPTVGCSLVSPGCTNCYAMKVAGRLEAISVAAERDSGGNPGPMVAYQGTTQASRAGFVWSGKVGLNVWTLRKPLAWKKPRRIFVNSMSDLFHESLPDDAIDQVFAVMALCPQHTFQVLTKRAARMREYLTKLETEPHRDTVKRMAAALNGMPVPKDGITIPLPNVWLGVSVEDQARADERIPLLLDTPAAKRFLSCEPLLGHLDLRVYMPNPLWNNLPSWKQNEIDWVIVGGESGGEAARPMHPDWARSLRDQCVAAGVAFFFKQWGSCLPGDFDGEDERGRAAYQIDEEHSSIDTDTLGKGRYVGAHGRDFVRFAHKNTGRKLDGREWAEFPK